jgi:hypothetical protein
MSLADWLATGAEPARMTPEEVRREQGFLLVREEQTIASLEKLLDERDLVFRKGAATRSVVLRRVMARRHSRLDAEVRALERELARIGKEVAGLTCLRRVLQSGVQLKAPGDCTPLLTLLDDASASEEEFADLFLAKIRADGAPETTSIPIVRVAPDVIGVWERLDAGEFDSLEDAAKTLHE